MTSYRWAWRRIDRAACFENEAGPPGPLALSPADLVMVDAQIAALAMAARCASGSKTEAFREQNN